MDKKITPEDVAKVTEEDIGNTLTSLAEVFREDLLNHTKEGLEDYWHFKYNPELPLERNLYHFCDRLELYHSFCRQWEEAKNGSCCVVERVRDQYLMPKIRQFAKIIRDLPKEE